MGRCVPVILMLLVFSGLASALEEDVAQGMKHVHDPSMIYSDGSYYVFTTGSGIGIRRSSDLKQWNYIGRVFSDIPDWVEEKVEGVSGFWAPDITYHNGKYYICYSASTFGSQTSVLGLASNTTLNPTDPNYAWVDEGEILESPPSSPPAYNAIDGTFVKDENGDMWLTFGSFWEGIMLTRLNSSTLKPAQTPAQIHHIARRSSSSAIEAPYITYRNGYYYLFVNWGLCCRGVDSTYKIVVGRSDSIEGPYLDKNGDSLLYAAGGTLFVGDSGRWIGPGHADITAAEGENYFTYHAYDALNEGTPTLRINYLHFSDQGWPVMGDSLTEPEDPPEGDTAAHWDFDDGQPGAAMNNTGQTAQPASADISGNDFFLYAWDDTYGPSFSQEGQTPSGLGLSCRLNGGQDAYTKDSSLNNWSPEIWTVELAVKLDNLNGWQTFLGRDGSSQGEAEADFYLQKNGINDKLRINFDTVGGQRYILDSSISAQSGKWYYLAAVSNGSELKIYADKLDGQGSEVVGALDLNSSNNNALASGGFNWTIGRGWFNGAMVDHVSGFIDDVKFSNIALKPSEFLHYQCGAWGYLEYDFNQDCFVDIKDFPFFTTSWAGSLQQLESFLAQWLESSNPYDS
ncbi:Intracellular endo-alpha-(1-_5)-L-arabinanase [Sedimentisphaera cyanobacteriorum]|uniref:Intracellular endo-alpha-(1->5)-L-arabinanase n=1 Tax=Sedimentisphaera cyanobacteriorum TaxID=1940790 RepID=A0A1Q2HN77_9BACT|nr:family 43 glycosylhydrolase [Sedimentisphaera cyanobacteriorum]AQQ08989.1 Intracellular endo-alpha-(1->5)-L-arabinanase [Sedimentisphaera cyanobacteriorum]